MTDNGSGTARRGDLAARLHMSELSVADGRIALSPALDGLPSALSVRSFWKGLAPAARTGLAWKWRGRSRQAPLEVSVLFGGRVIGIRLLPGAAVRGLVWIRSDQPPLEACLMADGLTIGLVRRDAAVEAASDPAAVGAPLFAIVPGSETVVRNALDRAAREGAAEISLDAHNPDGPAHRLFLTRAGEGPLVFLLADDTPARRASDRADNAVRELNHRVRNAMSVITALISLSAPHARNVDSFAKATLARVAALDTAYSLTGTNPLEPENYKTEVGLRALAERIVGTGDQVRIAQSPLTVSPGQATAIGLILHELATNARTHGSLSAPEGRLDLDIRPADGGNGGFALVWREKGGGRPNAPAPRFGLSIVKSFAENYLNGTVHWAPQPDGAVVTITAERS